MVRLLAIEDNVLHLANVDILDGTPLLDIKPYVPAFDRPKRARAGWLEVVQTEVRTRRADDRFRSDRS